MNVLVAMDGSKYGRWGLNWVAKLPFADPPNVTALHVVDIGALRAPFVAQPVVAGNERFIRDEIKRIEHRAAETLQEAKRLLASLKLNGRIKQEQGPVASVILRQAPKKNGMIVMGSQGLDALDRFMLGSVSTNVVQHASCPVLVVKTNPDSLRRILLAVDGSTSSKKALNFITTRLRPASNAGGQALPLHVTVLHIMPFLNYPELKQAGTELVDQYSMKLSRAGYSSEGLCLLGRPADEIITIAAHQKADLIVMGAKGQGAVARFLLGSVSTRVVQHAAQSVLVVR
ncbi:MAG TPA: universal stress protein [Nitrospira sp.]|nr:universal stress protein [Nitrospira sp.]